MMPDRIRLIFFIDFIGALVSAFMLAIVLPNFESYIGMPKHILYGLGASALSFALFSGFCYFLKPSRWRLALRTIALGNGCYCLASLVCMALFWAPLTTLGVFYFVSEKIIVITLVGIEVYHATVTQE